MVCGIAPGMLRKCGRSMLHHGLYKPTRKACFLTEDVIHICRVACFAIHDLSRAKCSDLNSRTTPQM